MPIRLDTRASDFGPRFRAFLDTKREAAADVESVVRAIIADVRARGDQALLDYGRKFDGANLASIGITVTAAETDAAVKACDSKALDALASKPITAGSGRRTIFTPTRSASNSATAGPRSRPWAFTCRAGRRPIRRRC
jgi:hypothetical protein